MNTGIMFPGGLALVDDKHTERKLADSLSPEVHADVWHDGTHWHVVINGRFGRYPAKSELGLLDACANSLQAYRGREECDPELT